MKNYVLSNVFFFFGMYNKVRLNGCGLSSKMASLQKIVPGLE